jgi:hypothetical protein
MMMCDLVVISYSSCKSPAIIYGFQRCIPYGLVPFYKMLFDMMPLFSRLC